MISVFAGLELLDLRALGYFAWLRCWFSVWLGWLDGRLLWYWEGLLLLLLLVIVMVSLWLLMALVVAVRLMSLPLLLGYKKCSYILVVLCLFRVGLLISIFFTLWHFHIWSTLTSVQAAQQGLLSLLQIHCCYGWHNVYCTVFLVITSTGVSLLVQICSNDSLLTDWLNSNDRQEKEKGVHKFLTITHYMVYTCFAGKWFSLIIRYTFYHIVKSLLKQVI